MKNRLFFPIIFGKRLRERLNLLKRQTTIVDIAKKLGISTSTVSRALKDHPDIKKGTKDLVKKIAVELNYSPNPIAQSLKSSSTRTIGVIVPEIKHDFFSSAISGIEEIAYRKGYTIILSQSNESYEREVINTNALLQHRVAGLIVSISQTTTNSGHFKNVLNRKVPLVFFDRVCDDVNTHKILIDDYQCAYDSVTYLIKKGYKRIAHFSGPKELAICQKRYKGYRDALEKACILLPNEFVQFGGMHEHNGYDAMNNMFKNNILPDAIFSVNDPVAIGAFQRIKEQKLRIPNDIAILGFSDNKIASLVEPQLTTVHQPSFEMGKISAEILIDTIENKITEPKIIVLEASLIIREST